MDIVFPVDCYYKDVHLTRTFACPQTTVHMGVWVPDTDGFTASMVEAPKQVHYATRPEYIYLRAKRASNLQGANIFIGCIKKRFPLGLAIRGTIF